MLPGYVNKYLVSKGRLQFKKTGNLMTSSKKVGGGWVKFIISNSL